MDFKKFTLVAALLAAPAALFAQSNHYISVTGAGSNDGSSWDNAMPFSTLCENIDSYANGDVFYFKEGTYVFSAPLKVTGKGYTFIGGFSKDLTGTSNETPTYPTATPTVFSGDVNGDGVASNGDADCLLSFTKVSADNHYIRPEVTDSDVLDIRQGRHPVIERQLPLGETYVANDVYLDSDTQQIIIITGPNMAGKSALLRQTALITLMAQIGCFVPAESAKIGVVDKIFTRVGASDNISAGESTFMVEMSEAASILNNLSPRSLVLFDELGRGTSTYDGISIAWAIVEYIHEHPSCRAKTLFATHYHELNEMERAFPRIKNYNVSVKEVDKKVIFLRKLVPGGSEHSFGIHVAKMAGMPQSIIKRSEQILKQLEADNRQTGVAKPVAALAQGREGYQLSIFQLDDPVLAQVRDEIMKADIDHLTPVEALNKLNEIKKIITGK